jgi:rhodanese-related sulfurtransferase
LKGFDVKFILDNWMLITVALSSGFLLLWPQIKAGSGISPAQAVTLINREKAQLIDVSEPDEFAKLRCNGAVNVPFGQLDAKLPSTVKNKNLPIVLVCPTGARAGRAVGQVKKLGYDNAQSLQGGTSAWQAANYPVQKAAA